MNGVRCARYTVYHTWAFASVNFRGSEGALNLRTHNLMFFVQLAEGVDAQTWMHHLRCHDYSRWFRDAIKDAPLAEEAERIKADAASSPAESVARLKAAIEQRYTWPAAERSPVSATDQPAPALEVPS